MDDQSIKRVLDFFEGAVDPVSFERVMREMENTRFRRVILNFLCKLDRRFLSIKREYE